MHLFYYLSSCDSCKKILKTLALSDDITQIDIKKSIDSRTIRSPIPA